MIQYQKKIKDLGIQEVELIRFGSASHVFICSGVWQGQKVLVKLIEKSNQIKLKQLNKEILVSKIILSRFNLDEINFTPVLCDGEDESFRWLIRKFVEGQSLVKFEQSKSTLLFGYDVLEKENLGIMPEVLSQLNKFLSVLNSIKTDHYLQPEHPAGLIRPRFSKTLDDEVVKNIQSLGNCDLNRTVEFYNQNATVFSDYKCICATHGDLVPANIIMSENNDIVFTDFEWFCFDHPYMDIAFFWLFLHNYPDIQTELVEKTILDTEGYNVFRAAVIRSAIGWYSSLGYFKQQKLEISESYASHVWLKYLVAAGESYESMLNVSKQQW